MGISFPVFFQVPRFDGGSLAPGFDLNQGLKQDSSTRSLQEHNLECGQYLCVRLKILWKYTQRFLDS